MTRNDLLVLIHTIKSYAAPPFIEDDAYYMREPWQKFGGVSSDIVMKWCWFRDEVILEKATEDDILKAVREMRLARNIQKLSFEQIKPNIEQCNSCLKADWEDKNKNLKFFSLKVGSMKMILCEDCAKTAMDLIAHTIK